MTDDDDLLRGLDAPLPLSADLRARLEQQLLAPALPLGRQQRADLLDALAPVRPRRRRWVAAAAAASGLAAAAVVALSLGRSTPAPAPVVALPPPTSTPSTTPAPLPTSELRSGFKGALPGPLAGPAQRELTDSPLLFAAGAGPLVLRDVAPRSSAGGQFVVLTGSGFTSGARVLLGDAEAQVVQVLSPYGLRVLLPGHAPGTVALTVVTGAGRSNALSFRYL